MATRLEPIIVFKKYEDEKQKLAAYSALKSLCQTHLDKNPDISELDLTDFANKILPTAGIGGVEVEVQIMVFTNASA